MSGESGSWTIGDSEDGGVVISFSHLGEDGVETFETSMPPEHALELGNALVDWAKELL